MTVVEVEVMVEAVVVMEVVMEVEVKAVVMLVAVTMRLPAPEGGKPGALVACCYLPSGQHPVKLRFSF